MFMLQQRNDINLYSFNKVSWCEGYDNKVQHFEKWRKEIYVIEPNKVALNYRNGGSQSLDRWLKEPRNNQM